MGTRTARTVERDRSIDALRGLLVVLLVFVEWLLPPGYEWLRHSPWDGVLVALGLVFNAFTTTDPLRFTGVLQMIGVSGFLAGIVTRFARRVDDVALAAGALLVVHGALLAHAWDLDRWVFPDHRLYRLGIAGHDPEGVLATVLGATALVLLGFCAARLRSWPFAMGLLGLALIAFVAWEPNKRAWTPTFTLFMAGAFAVALLTLRPVRVPLLDRIGRNALLVYLAQHAVRELVEPATDQRLLLAVGATVAFSAAAALLDRVDVRLRV